MEEDSVDILKWPTRNLPVNHVTKARYRDRKESQKKRIKNKQQQEQQQTTTTNYTSLKLIQNLPFG